MGSAIQRGIIEVLNAVGFYYKPYRDESKWLIPRYIEDVSILQGSHCFITFSLNNNQHTISSVIKGLHIVNSKRLNLYLQSGNNYFLGRDQIAKLATTGDIQSVRLYLDGYILLSDFKNFHNEYRAKAKLLCVESHLEEDEEDGYSYHKTLFFEKPIENIFGPQSGLIRLKSATPFNTEKLVGVVADSVEIFDPPDKVYGFYNYGSQSYKD